MATARSFSANSIDAWLAQRMRMIRSDTELSLQGRSDTRLGMSRRSSSRPLAAAGSILVLCVLSVEAQRVIPIPREDNISYGTFHTKYAKTSTPVVISGTTGLTCLTITLHMTSGATKDWGAMKWASNDAIMQLCGDEPLQRECDNNRLHPHRRCRTT